MDGIITIVVIAAAIIFKLVEKKLKGAVGDEVFPTISIDPDLIKDQDYDEKPVDEMVIEEAPRVLPPKPVKAEPSVKKDPAPILVEEEPKQKEKIDPKKLIVYSEIMKPKYME